MVRINFDSVEFRLQSYHDFSWLQKYGSAFYAIDETGSGCIPIGVENQDRKYKYFIKIAGVNTIKAEVSPKDSISYLKNACVLYRKIKHPNLIKIIEHYPYKNYYIAVFEWADGECLFDHWNFQEYLANPKLKPPGVRFKLLPIDKRLKTVEILFSFLQSVAMSGYVAVDFYDGSIIYNFNTDTTTICDIDLFRRKPAVNDIGQSYWGTKRLKAPEEYILGASIDERTNVFTLGALIFNFFGDYTKDDIAERYSKNTFLPCPFEKWPLNKSCYDTLIKAVASGTESRYQTIAEFYSAWNVALSAE